MKTYFLLFLFTFFFFGTSLRYGFSQDDWFFLYISKAESILDFLTFFSPWHQQGFPFYRPLGTQVYFFLGNLFGLSIAPQLMHFFMLLVHTSSSFIVYAYTRQITSHKTNALLVSLLYLGSGVHFLSLYYIAATQQLLATFFMLTTLYLQLSQKSIKWSYITFILALLSKENALLMPLYMLIIKFNWSLSWQHLKKLISDILPYGIISIFYLSLRLMSGIVVQSEYHPEIGIIKIITTLKAYLSFLLGYYEKIQDYSFPVLLPQYLLDTYPYGYFTLFSSVLIMLSIGYFVTIKISQRSKLSNINYLLAFFVGLVPWLFLPDHIFPHYIDFPVFCLSLFLITNLSSKLKYIVVLLFLVSGYSAIRSSEMLHWTVLRSNLNSRIIPLLKSQGICEAQSVQLVGETHLVKELAYSLSLNNGPRVFCDNDSIEVYYTPTNNSTSVDKIINLQGY